METIKNVKKTTRQSNLELSRIFAMFLIVMHHLSVHGGVPIWSGSFPLTANFYIDQLLATGGKIGVNLFVLISGYFLISKFSKFSSLVYLWIKTFFYVVVFFTFFSLLGIHKFTLSGFIACFFPIRNDFYWFVSAYFLLILLSPFITIGIKALGQNKLFAFLMIFGFVWSVVPTITTKQEFYGSTLVWFVYIFSWGAWLRSYLENHRIKQALSWTVLGSSWGSIALLVFLADLSNRHLPSIGYIDWFTFSNLTSVFSLGASLSLFILFKQMKFGYKPWINKIAGAMFGVYLIHENPIVYPWLWTQVFDVAGHLNNRYFILYALGVISSVFITCTLSDLFVEKTLRKIFSKFLLPRLQKYDEKINQFFSSP